MPEIQDGGRSDLMNYIREADQDLTVDSPATASILRSVEEQEAKFERLTQELQRDKLLVANQVNRSQLASETESINSISTTNDSFSFRRSAQQDSTVEDDNTLVGEEVNTNALIDSALKSLENTNMATVDSLGYNSYLQRSESYTHESYDNPSYDSPTRSHFSERQPAPGSPQGSYFDEYQPHHDDTQPEHRNPPPMGGGLEDYAPPPEDGYISQQNEDFGYKEDYNQRDPSGVTSGYDSDTIPRDAGGYGYDSLPGKKGHQIPAPEEPHPRGDGYSDQHYPDDVGYPGNEVGYVGDDPGYHGDEPSYREDRGYPTDNYVQDDGSVQHELGYQPGDGRYGNEDFVPQVDEYGEPAIYPDSNDGDLRRDPAYEGDIVPEGMQTQEAAFGGNHMGDDEWRSPDLSEVIDYLSSRDEGRVANAAAYLQHLTYGDDGIKNKTRGLNGIPVLVELLNNKSSEIHRSACGALRNISFGKGNEENKVAIKNANGVATLIRLLRHSQNAEIREMVTGTLWNLSSSESLKMVILDEAVRPLLKNELIPETGWDPQTNENVILQNEQPWSRIFLNCLGVIRNVSSGGIDARRRLRNCEGLIDILIHILSGAVGNRDMDTKCVEHAICIIRNLSYQTAQEIDHPDTASTKTATQDKKNQQQKAPPAGKADVFSCFSGNKKKQPSNYNSNNTTGTLGRGTLEPPSLADGDKPTGVEYMWNLGSVRVYVTLLSEASNAVTLEAAAGTIQNITAGDSRMAINVRAHVRKEKGLPIMVELLRIDNDRVVLALARALRNLAVDARNKELIGQYAMKDIVIRLPGGGSDNSVKALSMESLAAVLHLLHEVIKTNQEHAKALRNANGIDAVIGISKAGHKYPPAVIKASIMVLHTLWGFRDLRHFYRTDGFDERDFLTGVWTVKRNTTPGNPKTSTSNGKHVDSSNTLSRSSQPEMNSAPLPVNNFPSETLDSRRSDYGPGSDRGVQEKDYGYDKQDILDQRHPHEDIPLQDLHITQQDQLSDVGSFRPPVGGVPVYGRAPEPQVESRLTEQEDYRQEQTRSPSHESNYASDYGRTDSYRRDDYSQRDDYSHQDGYAPPQDNLSQQGSYRPNDYREDGYRGDYSSTTQIDGYNDLPDKVGPGGDNRREDYGYIAEYGQDDWSNQPGNYSVRLDAEPGQKNEPNSDSWV
ncbi:uncharacterized protein [Apostichopus japonicus]|uniref:uncharacterized protein isoform X2 n=1 Tax=Stichopus japonicus TaxID=307972 RepID=UPI003AB1DD7B